ncbi:hypothetical protein BT69DRAFT_1358338 [Atractiella rhizophila]|nr:hypothetical protein BT69DRAFT_1358338 [Atractiella rhizophila]
MGNGSKKSAQWKAIVVLTLSISLLLSTFFRSKPSLEPIAFSALLDQVDSAHFLLATVFDISSPSSPSSGGVEAINMSEIYLLSTTPQMVPKYNVGLASKFEEYVKDVRRALEVKDWKYTTDKLALHIPGLQQRLQDLVKNSGLAANWGFEALVGLGHSKKGTDLRESDPPQTEGEDDRDEDGTDNFAI